MTSWGLRRWAVGGACAAWAALGHPSAALAHAGERGFVLLLPTAYWIVGGTLAVAASFLMLLVVPAASIQRIAAMRIKLLTAPRVPVAATSAASFLLLVLLLAAGLYGSRDPLSNPLPLTVWALWWVGLTIAQAVFGNLWAALNPWVAPCRLLCSLAGGAVPLTYPAWLGYWPAVAGFLGFAWFELIDLAPDDPARLALAVSVYSAVTLVGMLLFGERAWLARAECFSVFFGFASRLSPLGREKDASARRTLVLRFPGTGLAGGEALPVSGVLFVLLTLATVSFDGLSKTFWWLGLGGINPLEFPGRSAVVGLNSAGLAAMWAALVAAYGIAIGLGVALAGRQGSLRCALGAFVLSILPISIGYHFAHYLPAVLVDAQYAALALADPFARGWDPVGLEGAHVTVSFLYSYDAVSVIWKLQAAAVVAGHVLAVLVAHAIAVERFGDARTAALSQLPLAILMIAYTLFGLWLLAAPTAG